MSISIPGNITANNPGSSIGAKPGSSIGNPGLFILPGVVSIPGIPVPGIMSNSGLNLPVNTGPEGMGLLLLLLLLLSLFPGTGCADDVPGPAPTLGASSGNSASVDSGDSTVGSNTVIASSLDFAGLPVTIS